MRNGIIGGLVMLAICGFVVGGFLITGVVLNAVALAYGDNAALAVLIGLFLVATFFVGVFLSWGD